MDAKTPTNVDETRSFLGLALYYSRFIPNASTLLHPLNSLLRKNMKFKWSTECENAFKKIKQEIASDRVLTPYNPDLPLTLSTDASPYELGAIISHIINGEERPIAFASKSLTKAESQYSQLDREATAIYWSFKRFYQYLFGRKFTLIIDNRPLLHIFNPNKSMPIMSAHRLLRYSQFITGFNYEIKHRTSKHHGNVDYLSRNHILLNTNLEEYKEDPT